LCFADYSLWLFSIFLKLPLAAANFSLPGIVEKEYKIKALGRSANQNI